MNAMSVRKLLLGGIVLLFQFMSTGVFASDFEVDGICYNILPNTSYEVEVTSKIDKKYGTNIYRGDISIPSDISYSGITYKVTAIGEIAFYGCGHNIKSVTLPNTIKTIGDYSFKSLWDIKSIDLPLSLITIGREAFCDCQSLESIDIPENVTSIGANVFNQCKNLKSVIVGKSLKDIGNGAFSYCSLLGKIDISNVETLGRGAFAECTNLRTVILPQNLQEILDNTFYFCKSLKSVIIPESVRSIGDCAFCGCSALDTVISKIEEPFDIPEYVFQSSAYNGQTIKHSVLLVPYGSKSKYQQYVGWYNYFNKIEEEIPNYSFTIISSGNGVVSFEGNTIRNNNYTFSVNAEETISITITPDDGYRIKSVKVNGTTVSVSNNKYTISSISDDMTVEVEFEAIPKIISFADANVKAICIANWDTDGDGELSESEAVAVTDLGTFFKGSIYITSFEELKYFLGIKNIPSGAFKGCTSLATVSFPETVMSIEDEAFYECRGLKGPLTLPNSLRTIGNYAFYRCTSITGSLVIPNSVISIGTGAFYQCIGFNGSLTLPNSITTIEDAAFYGCRGLTGFLTLPPKITSIGEGAFIYCKGFTGSLTIPNSVKTIKNDAFRECSGLSGLLTIPNSVTNIGIYAFYRCSGLKNVQSMIETPFDIDETVFNQISSDAILTVPKGTINSYKSHSGWIKNFKDVKEEGVVSYTMTITASGNGSASYDGTTIRSKTSSFTVNEGTSATITFSPDNGYRIKNVKVNGSSVTVSNNKYTISSINSNTTVSVEFEAIPPTTYTLSITASGNGSASYNSTTIRSKTSSFTVTEGSSATISFTPDNGYRIKSVKVNGSTVSVSSNKYTISSINSNTTVSVEFEAITYTLSITASGNGSATYNGTAVRGKTSSFTVNEGTSATITFAPDNGYRIKTVKVNGSTVTVSNNQYTISNINANTTISVEFEAIPVTTYTLSITASGYGSASYNSTTIRSKTSSFTVNEGTSATITFTPDNGYRIKTVKVNNSTVTISNNKYMISSINSNTTVSVEFEAIPPTTYTLSITASGNGSASYNSTTIRSKTTSFTVNEGTSATITFTPDNGYRIKSVKVNGSTVSVSNNKYTISSINSNTTVSVEFEAIPPTTYTLSITASGNGSASYNSTTIRGKTSSFTVNEGTSATITFTPDNGYRIKTVNVNNSTVTVSNNKYTISSINSNTTVSVEFEAITYTLSITASGYGSASYNSTSIRNKTTSFTVNEGTSATITFSPDNGYRIKSVKVNGSTVSVSNSKYTISSINSNTTVSVEFEAIPPTTYTLSITASGNGSASYNSTTIRSKTSSFTVNEGSSATITFTPDNGYRIKTVKVNGSTITVSNNKYTISSINRNTTVSVEFEAIPITTYTLSITATGSGSARYNNATIRSKTSAFTVNEGTNATITFAPDNGYRIKSVKLNSSDVTSYVSSNSYTISNITKNSSLEVEFAEELKTFTSGGINYSVSSYDDKTIIVGGGNYGKVLEVPAEITYQDIRWMIVGIDNAALADNTELAAIIWNPAATFTLNVSNPNLLLYVTSANYAPSSITNVVVNNTANKIVLSDAVSGNDFYCPKDFSAKSISYTHNYLMTTGIGESRGWESIALPFDVQKIAHYSKGEITPFANWKSGDSKKPFWLMTYGTGGWSNASSIKANTPYIISMPNHSDYKTEFRLNGTITFSSENVIVKKSDNVSTGSYDRKTFIPCYSNKESSSYYVLNVINDYVTYNGGANEGSSFVLGLRAVRPFEAYMTSSSSAARTIAISDDMTTGIEGVDALIDEMMGVRVYNLSGQLVIAEMNQSLDDVKKKLPAGVYIVNGKKLIIK